ncbi:taste receptor type 2 member 39-like [Leptodactylus fuscus]|uniref:taste receptor type 2 member 39-like n=1 Tax=Leptodactylus fuscus TaxID=238119 RepID=UPI003F4E9BD9
MHSPLEYTLISVLYTVCLAGILVNTVILAAIFLKWKTQRCLPTYYKILICLLMSRSLHLLSYFFGYIISVFSSWSLLDTVFILPLTINLIILQFTNLWFATVLCVYYCVKITSYSWKLWILLKTKLSTLVPCLLLASLLISITSSLSFSFHALNLKPQNVMNGTNMTGYNVAPINFQAQSLITLLGSCPPFLIFCITIFLLLHSLWTHTRRMRGSGSEFRSPNLESHFSAVKSMSLFLFLQIIYFITLNFVLSGKIQNETYVGILMTDLYIDELYLGHVIKRNGRTSEDVLHLRIKRVNPPIPFDPDLFSIHIDVPKQQKVTYSYLSLRVHQVMNSQRFVSEQHKTFGKFGLKVIEYKPVCSSHRHQEEICLFINLIYWCPRC